MKTLNDYKTIFKTELNRPKNERMFETKKDMIDFFKTSLKGDKLMIEKNKNLLTDSNFSKSLLFQFVGSSITKKLKDDFRNTIYNHLNEKIKQTELKIQALNEI